MITLLMLALFAMMLWELAAGTVRVLPLVIGLGAFLATTWLLLTPMVAVCGVFVAAVLVRDLVRVRHGSFEEGNRRLYWSLGLAALVAVVMLAPTLSEQFTLSPGNITELVGLAPSVAADRAGLAEAWDVVSIQFTAHPSWLGTVPLGYDSRVTTGEFRLPVVFVVWVMAAAGTVALMVGRRNESEARTALVGAVWLHVVVAFLTAGFLVSMALVWGGFLSWLIEPTRALGMMMALAIFFTVGSALPSRIRSAVRRPTEVVLGLGSLALVVALSFGAAGAGSPRGELSPALAELARGASDGITAHDDAGHDAAGSQNEVVLVRSDAAVGIVFGADEFGIAELSAFLERAGIDVVVDQDRENRFGAERAHPERADAELFLRSRPGPPPGAGWELVDRVDPLTSEQRSERSRVESKLDEMAHGSTMAELLVRAEDDPELDRLLQQSFAMVDQPVLYLWYRSLEKV